MANATVSYCVACFRTELAASIGATLRRSAASKRAEPSEPHVFGDLIMDYADGDLTLAG